MELTSFNQDILHLIVSCIDKRHDLNALVRTCRELYSIGVDKLASYPISLDAERRWTQFQSFCSFMLVDVEPRSYRLREVEIKYGGFPKYLEPESYPHEEIAQTMGSMLEIFKHATCLKTLKIHYSEEFLYVSEQLVETITALRSLECVEIFDTGEKTEKMIKQMTSPIPRLHYEFWLEPNTRFRNFGSLNIEKPRDPIPFFETLSSSLVTLSLTNVSFKSLDVQYPKVEFLKVEHCTDINTAPIMHAFPNLRRLHLYRHGVNEFERRFQLDPEPVRSRNRKDQEKLRLTWSQIQYVHMDVPELYLMAPKYRIPHLHTDVFDYMRPAMLSTVLLDTLPSHLTLSIHFSHLRANPFPDSIPDVSLQYMKHIEIELKLGNPVVRYAIIFASLFAFLKRQSSISCFTAQLECPMDPLEWKQKYLTASGSTEPIDPVGAYIKGLDPKEFTLHIARLNRNIRHVFLRIYTRADHGPHEGQEWTYWRITQEREGPVVNEIDADTAEKVRTSLLNITHMMSGRSHDFGSYSPRRF